MSNQIQLTKVWHLTETKYSQVTTIEQAIDADSWSLGRMNKHYGERDMCGLIAVMLSKLTKAAGITKPMEGEQLKFIASNIILDYPTLKMADLVLFFQRLVKGHYGELYNNLSTDKIFSNLNKYVEERMKFSEVRSQRKHLKSLEKTRDPLDDEQVKQLYTKMKNDPDL